MINHTATKMRIIKAPKHRGEEKLKIRTKNNERLNHTMTLLFGKNKIDELLVKLTKRNRKTT